MVRGLSTVNSRAKQKNLQKIELITPKIEYSREIVALREELVTAKDSDSFAGCGSLRACATAESWIDELEKYNSAETCPNGCVTSSTFLAVRVSDGRLVGIIELRHRIDTPILSTWGGHIGFSVRPSERNKGYAREMLRLLLAVCAERGMSRVLVTCNSKNFASERTIIANGGIFEKHVYTDSGAVKRYWISL